MIGQLKRNDTNFTLDYTILNEDGSVVDLTASSVKFIMGKKNTLITNNPAAVVSPVNGMVSYEFQATDTMLAGNFLAEFEVTFANGHVTTYPINSYIAINIQPNLDDGQSTVILDSIAAKQGDFEKKLDEILKLTGNGNPEIVAARGGFVNLAARLDDDTVLVKGFTRQVPEVDDLGKIHRAIDFCNAQGKRKLIFTENLVITSSLPLNLKSNIDYIGLNSTLDFSGRTGYASDDLNPLIHGQGSRGAVVNITANALKGTNILTVTSTSGLQVGDLIFISSLFEWTGDSTNHQHGEMAIVQKVTNATTLEISACLHEDYKLVGDASQDDVTQVTLSPFMQKITPIENVTISGFTFKAKGRSATGLRGDYGMVFRQGRNIKVKYNKFDRMDQCSLDFINVFDFEAYDNDIMHDVKNTGVNNDYIQYGIKFSNASIYGNIEKNRIWNGRHGVIAGHITDFGGIQRHVNIENNFVSGTWHGGYAVHNSCEFIKLTNNTAIRCEYGINLRVGHVEALNNHLFFCTFGFYLSIKPERMKIQGNRIINPSQSAIIMSGIMSSWVPNDIEILDNICDGGGISLIMNNSGVMKRGWKVCRNTVKNITLVDAISVLGRVKGKFDDNEVFNVTGASKRGMRFTEVMYSTITGNSIEGTTSAPIEITGLSDWNTICDNSMFDHDYATAVLNSGTGANNKIYDNTNKTTSTGTPIS